MAGSVGNLVSLVELVDVPGCFVYCLVLFWNVLWRGSTEALVVTLLRHLLGKTTGNVLCLWVLEAPVAWNLVAG